MRFLRRLKILFLWSKKVSFLSRTSLNLISSPFLTENKENNCIIRPKAWVNPFERVQFWNFIKFCLYSQKVFFLSRTLLNLISILILTETKKLIKIAFFDQEHGLTSLEK